MLKKILPGLFAGAILTYALVYVLTQLPEMASLPALRTAKVNEILEPLQLETALEQALLEKEQITLQRLELRKRQDEIKAERAYIPIRQRNKELRAFMWTGALAGGILFCFVAFPVIFWFKSAEIAAMVAALRRNDMDPGVERALVMRDIKMLELRMQQNKALGITGQDMFDAIDAEACEIQPIQAHIPDAMECLNMRMFDGKHEFFFGTDKEGKSRYEDLQPKGIGFYHVGLIGEGRIGKSNFLVNLGTQAMLKGQLVLAIDLHFPNKQSFTEKFGVLRETPNFRGYHDITQAIEAIHFLDTVLSMRLSGKMEKNPGIVVICDELKNFMRLVKRMGDKMLDYVVGIMERLTEEGGKNDISFIVASHTWKAEDVGTTAWRDLLNFRVGLRSTPRQAQTFGIDKDYKNRFKTLQPGEIIYEDSGGEYHQCQTPLWTPEAIKKAASMVKVASWPNIEHPTPDVLEQYQEDVLVLDDYRKPREPRLRRFT